MPKITPFLWFDNQAEEAATLYTSLYPDSSITNVQRYGPGGPVPEGTVMTVEFSLDGQTFTALNGGPAHFTFNDSVSFAVNCADQDEIDYYWNKLTEGGEECMCGWLKDRYGLSWQVVPEGAVELFSDPDPGRAHRAFQAMMQMKKLDLAELRRAADSVPA